MTLAMRHDTLLPLLKDLCVDGATSKTVGVARVNDATVYHALEKDAILMIRARNRYVAT